MLDKARYGTRHVCFQCGTKFYDLNRPTPTCPECSADQREAPVRDVKQLLSSKGSRKDSRDSDMDDLDDEDLDEDLGGEEDGDDDDDELGLLGDDDDDEGGGGEDLD